MSPVCVTTVVDIDRDSECQSTPPLYRLVFMEVGEKGGAKMSSVTSLCRSEGPEHSFRSKPLDFFHPHKNGWLNSMPLGQRRARILQGHSKQQISSQNYSGFSFKMNPSPSLCVLSLLIYAFAALCSLSIPFLAQVSAAKFSLLYSLAL